MGFIPSKAKADIWMRENNDLLIAARNPKEIVQTFEEQHKLKLKGVVPLTFHLGCDCFRSKKIHHKDDGSIQEYVRLKTKGIHIAIRKG
jgi:hypothetical protein